MNVTKLELYIPENTLVIGISQTGTSSITVDAIRKIKVKSFEVLTITNQPDSTLAELGNESLELLVGKEDCNAKNEGFINLQKRKMTDSVYNLLIVFQVFYSLIPFLNGIDPNRNLNDDYAELVSTRQD